MLFFVRYLNPLAICEKLSLYYNIPILPGESLLFFDEIQQCPPAISSLRFFYEKYPELHLITAGSLLEFTLSELPSFAAGRVRSLFMYPLSFNEFLMAHQEDRLLNAKKGNLQSAPPNIRSSLENFSEYESIKVRPLYSLGDIT